MIDLTRRNFLKGVAAGAGLALATGIPGVATVEAAVVEAAEREIATGYADFLIGLDGEMKLVGQVVSIYHHRVASELTVVPRGGPFEARFKDHGTVEAELVADDQGLSLLHEAINFGVADIETHFKVDREHMTIFMPSANVHSIAVTLHLSGGSLSAAVEMRMTREMEVRRATA